MRNRFFLAVAVILALLPGNLAYGQANLPNNPNAATVQGPDPTGMLGYPLATVPATGALPWPVAIQSFAASVAVTQGTSPWVTDSYGLSHTQTGTLALTNDSVAVSTLNCGSVAFQLSYSAGWSGQVFFQGTLDGTVWKEVACLRNSQTLQGDLSNEGWQDHFNGSANVTTNFQAATGGFTQFRVFARSVVSGTCSAILNASTANVSLTATYPFNNSTVNLSTRGAGVFALYLDRSANTGRFATCLPDPVQNSQFNLTGANVYPQYVLATTARYDPTTGRIPVDRATTTFQTVATAAAGNTALWTPAAGKKFRLMRYMVTVTDQATQAGAGTLTFSLFDGAAGVTGQVHDVFVPALGLVNTGSLYTSGWIDLGNGYLSTAANNVLNINLSAALTAGTVRVICCGTEE